jgi:tetraacyldisaccharide 4'-kinase
MNRPWALPLQPLYRIGLTAKNALYTRNLLPVRHLQQPVISVGSLSAGGAGKTPFVLALAKLFEHEGISVDVLSRGYSRRSSIVERVDAKGNAGRFGDEPLELAHHGVEVFVGADRLAAGTLAERTHAGGLHLLDDGFQHRRLTRALDIVLLTLEDAGDHLLPAGNLREPLSSLRRASVIVVRREEADALSPVLARHQQTEVWQIERRLELPQALPARPVVFCAIARPANFVALLRENGIQPAHMLGRPDHHVWNSRDMAHLVQTAERLGADGFLTTAKDAVKLAPNHYAMLEPIGPLIVAELSVSLLDPAQALRTIRMAAGIG